MRTAAIALLCALAGASAAGASAASWSLVRYPTDHGLSLSLSAVACTGRDSCEAVGSRYLRSGRSLPLAERWNGSRWTRQRIPTPRRAETTDLASVSCTTRSACTAVGSVYRQHPARVSPLIARWDGSRWSLQASRVLGARGQKSRSALRSVSCVSARWCMAIGQYGSAGQSEGRPAAEQWDGSRWSLEPITGSGAAADDELASLSCTSTHACVAVGTAAAGSESDMALAESWDGSGWSVQSPATPASAYDAGLSGVACTAAAGCEAVGSAPVGSSFDQVLIEGSSGSTWSLQPAPFQPFASLTKLSSVACPSASACEAVGIYQDSLTGDLGPLAARWDGSQWSLTLLPVPPQRAVRLLGAVSCISPDWCLGVGENLAERYS